MGNEWWERGTAFVLAENIAAGNVTSEKGSTNLITRSYQALIPTGASSCTDYSSDYILWRPLIPIQVQRIQLRFPRPYALATADNLTIFNAGSSMVDFALGSTASGTSSTSITAGTRISSTSSVASGSVGACQNITAKFTASTCSVPGMMAVLFDYVTTG